MRSRVRQHEQWRTGPRHQEHQDRVAAPRSARTNREPGLGDSPWLCGCQPLHQAVRRPGMERQRSLSSRACAKLASRPGRAANVAERAAGQCSTLSAPLRTEPRLRRPSSGPRLPSATSLWRPARRSGRWARCHDQLDDPRRPTHSRRWPGYRWTQHRRSSTCCSRARPDVRGPVRGNQRRCDPRAVPVPEKQPPPANGSVGDASPSALRLSLPADTRYGPARAGSDTDRGMGTRRPPSGSYTRGSSVGWPVEEPFMRHPARSPERKRY